ncbi:phage holin family protein [Candidatus Saccharibacteria bacterium]|nr:phage holin family protein [Candidatus Saccharibacteria bacterium]
MIKQQILVFLLRWLVSSATMWLCISLFGQITDDNSNGFWLYVAAGLVFSLVNSIVKPLATMFSLPLIILSMGIFTFILNIAMVALTIWILPHVTMNFWGAVLSTILISLINGLVNFLVPAYNKK